MSQATAAAVVNLNEIRGKTEQRVSNVVAALKASKTAMSYDDLIAITGSTYDSLLYILATLCEVGMVTRLEVPEGPGRPKVQFQWVNLKRAQAQGA